MIKESSIKISYYDVIGISNHSFNRFKRLRDFKTELDAHYSSVIKRRVGDADPKVNDLVIEISIPQTLANSLDSVQSKSFSKLNFVIQPFIRAFRDFRALNPLVDIEEMIISFADCSIIIDRVSQHSVYNQLENLIDGISENYQLLTNNGSEQIFEIFIPVYEQPLSSVKAVQQLLAPLQISSSKENNSYYSYWGVYYNSPNEQCVVFDVKQKKMVHANLDAEFVK